LRNTVHFLGRGIDDFRSYTWYDTVDEGDTRARQGKMDLTDIPLPDDVHAFTCGPLPFMRSVRSMLLTRGLPPTRIRYEVFGPDLWAAQSSPNPES
jgi:nitric oxide dioxygenase